MGQVGEPMCLLHGGSGAYQGYVSLSSLLYAGWAIWVYGWVFVASLDLCLRYPTDPTTAIHVRPQRFPARGAIGNPIQTDAEHPCRTPSHFPQTGLHWTSCFRSETIGRALWDPMRLQLNKAKSLETVLDVSKHCVSHVSCLAIACHR